MVPGNYQIMSRHHSFYTYCLLSLIRRQNKCSLLTTLSSDTEDSQGAPAGSDDEQDDTDVEDAAAVPTPSSSSKGEQIL